MKYVAITVLLSSILVACASSDSKNDTNGINIDPTPASITLKKIGQYSSHVFAQSGAEIPVFDPVTKQAFVVNAQKGAVDVLDLTDPENPKLIGEMQANLIEAGAVVNSVAVANGIVALAVQASNKTDIGLVAFYQASDLSLISHAKVGALPDMLTFTPDGKTLLAANEAEPSSDYQIDPEGSIAVIDVSNINQPTVHFADFSDWNDKAQQLREQGVRIFGPNASVSKDLEPEYITIAKDGKTAWVTLQENNALAIVDIATAKVTDIVALGYKDHGLAKNALDLSDADDKINIQPWAGVRGLYMPDSISSFESSGKTYLVTANEGDARAWGEDDDRYWAGDASKGFVEELRVKHLVHSDGFDRRAEEDLPPQLRQLAKAAELNPKIFGYCGAIEADAAGCRQDDKLGRLNVTWTMGYQTNADGTPKLNARGHLVYDALYSFGARSFSIWDDTGNLVWDSADQFEQKVAELFPDHFNSNHVESQFDDRSDSKGPEPEGVAVGQIGDKTFAFIGLERVGGVMVYDVTMPNSPQFMQYINTRDFSATEQQTEAGEAGDLGPEGLSFVAAKDSPNQQPLLVVGNEVSGTTSIFQIDLNFTE